MNTTSYVCLCIALLWGHALTAQPLPPLLPEDLPQQQEHTHLWITQVQFSGNRVLSSAQLQAPIESYLNRPLAISELSALRDAVTQFYIDQGYISSGAQLPQQPIENGVLRIHIIEGVLSQVDLHHEGRLHSEYLYQRVKPWQAQTLHVSTLENQLQLLQQNPLIERVQTQLVPGQQLGESLLHLKVIEAPVFQGSIALNNYSSPSVGEEALDIHLAHHNVSGWGDRLQFGVRATEGLETANLFYQYPLGARGGKLSFAAQYSQSQVITESFHILDIESASETYSIAWEYPIYRSPTSGLSLSSTLDYRRSESFLLGAPFSFSPGAENGVASVSVLRLGQSWRYRRPTQVFQLQSTLSVGLNTLGATHHSGDTPDGRFVKWQGQLHYAQQLPWLNSQFMLRHQLQLSDGPLLGLEKFALGGHSSVRGYRENFASSDNGALLSLEWKIPLGRLGSSYFSLSPFVDGGYVWEKRPNPSREVEDHFSSGGIILVINDSTNTINVISQDDVLSV